MTSEKILNEVKYLYRNVLNEMGKVIIGQEDIIGSMLISIFTGSHALLEGYPGLGKTMMVKSLSKTLGMDFGRIQCTPDLMPSDITGTYVIEEDPRTKQKKFRFQKGPVFTNVLLADEINRASPKTQSSLLESMQEVQATIGNNTFPIEPPFFVLATQNPIEMEGTYPLPEAQLDRFLLKILVKYPSVEEEDKIIDRFTSENEPDVKAVLDKSKIINIQKLTKNIPISNEIRHHALRIVAGTRPSKENKIAKQYLDYGASPRASIGIVLASKARALINGRNYVSKDDIETIALPVLRHRLILNFESEREGITADDVITSIIKEVK